MHFLYCGAGFQVTEAHRIKVVEDKPADERGLYLHPEEYGQPKEKGIEYAHHPLVPVPSQNSRQDSAGVAELARLR